MKIQFANGKTYSAKDIDDAIAQCLAIGDDPFNPVVIEDKTETKQNADTVSE